MSEMLLSSRNLAFELYEVLDAEGLTQRERFAEHTRETFDAAIDTARNIAEKYFAPHNRKGDENEPRYEDGQAILIPFHSGYELIRGACQHHPWCRVYMIW